ncbi:PDZ and LIM domain protein Zasp-like isoform X1 [Dreissena polymorpha]|uniref:PDZ and LIM domain protein Zasp-like isoform X1 n=1 Tax=Dreissena polymorpha TaxID=45954 RepID=UPI002264BF9D|nr:PDZ and LIM domain protein Zasp-like isoform X1 [Dreissena polymorpha]
MGDEQPETLQVRLSRPDSGLSWGFRLQGGTDFNTPLSVQVVQPKSVAERCGLRAGDGIVRINNRNTDGLTHEQAKMEIIRSCNDIDMLIMRGAVQIWRPKVTPMSELKPTEKPQPIHTATGDQVFTTQKTSLARDHQDESNNIGSSYNRSAKPFGGQAPRVQTNLPTYPTYPGTQNNYGGNYGPTPESPKKAVPNVVHAQFNTPIGLYSADNIAHTYAQQTSGIQKEMQNLDVEDAPVGQKFTGTYQRLDSSDSQNFGTTYGSPKGDDVNSSCGPQSGSPTSFQSYQAWSPKGLQNVQSIESLQDVRNGVNGDEHDPTDTNSVFNSSSQPGGFRSVKAPTATSNPAPPPKQESMHCTGCGNLVTGVFVRIKGMPYHEKCFKCARCGVFLKQKGYFMIEGQLCCEVHARQTAQAPGDNMRYAGAVYN